MPFRAATHGQAYPGLVSGRNSDRLYADRDPLCTKQDSHDLGAQTAHDNVGGRVVFFASTKMGIGNIASPFNARSLTHSEPGMRETANCPRVPACDPTRAFYRITLAATNVPRHWARSLTAHSFEPINARSIQTEQGVAQCV
ncbi:MAG: hypothetical protein JWO79_4110 [Actinomycetia bacterium]|jgi:hypothetical protein|nr:hypothetical protein [Actinomycetes bacterium]